MTYEQLVDAGLTILNSLRAAMHGPASVDLMLKPLHRQLIRDIAGVYRESYPFSRGYGRKRALADETDWRNALYFTMPLSKKTKLSRWFLQ